MVFKNTCWLIIRKKDLLIPDSILECHLFTISEDWPTESKAGAQPQLRRLHWSPWGSICQPPQDVSCGNRGGPAQRRHWGRAPAPRGTGCSPGGSWGPPPNSKEGCYWCRKKRYLNAGRNWQQLLEIWKKWKLSSLQQFLDFSQLKISGVDRILQAG